MIWGHLLACSLTLLNGMSLAEICSAFPLNGSIYVWVKKLTN